MIGIPAAIDVPLRTDENGVIRVGKTRVTLTSVIADFHRGATPEKIVHDFSTLKIADVYHVIAYYLNHRAEVDAYIQQQDERAEQLRREWEATHPPTLTKAVLLQRLETKSTNKQKVIRSVGATHGSPLHIHTIPSTPPD